MPNPRYPLFFTRQDHRDDPFAATRWWYDLDGSNRRIAVPTLEQCHMCWLGSGEYLLLGTGLIRGRRWDQPLGARRRWSSGRIQHQASSSCF